MDLVSLPFELLPTIFGFLSLEDRKNVRLTCQLFRDACDRADIVKREKFVFHFGHFGAYADPSSEFAEYIGDYKRIRPAVEFRAVSLNFLPLTLWESLGDRITSLLLDHCHVNDMILARIFLHCSELVDFHASVHNEIELFAVEPNPLDQLIALGIERSKLCTFKLFARRPVSDNTFGKIFKIFPNIKTFGRGYYGWMEPTALLNIAFGSTLPIPTRIEFPPSVENFVYHQSTNGAWMVSTIEYTIPKFKELELTLEISNDENLTNVVNFLSSQTELKKIHLVTRVRGSFRFPETIILNIIRRLPELEALTFHSHLEMRLSELEFIEFVTTLPKNLKSLDLGPIGCTFEPSSKPELPSIDYCALTHLRLDFLSGWKWQSEILSRCRSLRCLRLENTDKYVLERILKHHTELKKLSLDCAGFRSLILKDKHFSVRLQKLECLDVRNLRSFNIVRFVSKLDCPNLKVLRCVVPEDSDPCLSAEDTITVLETLCEKTPLLETLILSSALSVYEYHPLCRNLKKLRYLVLVQCDPRMRTDAFKELFDACPSLTLVVHTYCGEARARSYNRTTQSVLTYSPGLSFYGGSHLDEILNISSYK